MAWWQISLGLYATVTAGVSMAQILENNKHGRSGEHWAPVWWVALTWPFWLVVIGFDIQTRFPVFKPKKGGDAG